MSRNCASLQRLASMAVWTVSFVALPMQAPAQTARTPATVPTAAVPVPAGLDDDARRAAAARLLAASRFRERQAVLLKDALRVAESEMAEECLNRAAAGQSMKTCNAIAAPSPAMTARLAASESDMLDEVMAASQTIYARKFTVEEMDGITRFFRTAVGQRYGALYPQTLSEVQQRKRVIARRYLTAAAGTRP